jgi:hypothetical protein
LEPIKERFESDFEAAPSASAVVYKITEIKQAAHEDVIAYFGKCIKRMIEFKSKIDAARFLLLLLALTAAKAAVYGEVPLVIKAAAETHMKTAIIEITLDNVNAIFITAGLKSEL